MKEVKSQRKAWKRKQGKTKESIFHSQYESEVSRVSQRATERQVESLEQSRKIIYRFIVAPLKPHLSGSFRAPQYFDHTDQINLDRRFSMKHAEYNARYLAGVLARWFGELMYDKENGCHMAPGQNVVPEFLIA